MGGYESCGSVTILLFFIIDFADIGDQLLYLLTLYSVENLIRFANRKITVWLSCEERMGRFLPARDKFMSTQKLALG